MSIESQAQELPPDFEAEIALLWAVLERAMQDALGNHVVCNDEDEDTIEEAREFLSLFEYVPESECDTPEPFTFPWICNQLNLSTIKIRDTLENLILEGHSRTRSRILSKSLKSLLVEIANNNKQIAPHAETTLFYDGEVL